MVVCFLSVRSVSVLLTALDAGGHAAGRDGPRPAVIAGQFGDEPVAQRVAEGLGLAAFPVGPLVGLVGVGVQGVEQFGEAPLGVAGSLIVVVAGGRGVAVEMVDRVGVFVEQHLPDF